jgi:hypothetical protein
MLFLLNFDAQAQCANVQGDQLAYGTDQWIGYVYNGVPTGNPPDTTPFVSTTYAGYITRTETFDQNIAAGSLPAESTLCTGTYSQNFAIRYKMKKTLAAGYYTFTVGGDDGYRFSTTGAGNWITGLSDWAEHSYGSKTATVYHAGGVMNLVLEYYERGGDSRVSVTGNLAACTTTAPTAISGTLAVSCNITTTLTATGGTAGTGATYQWGTGTVGSNIIAGATTASVTVQPLAASTTYWVRRIAAAPCSNTTDAATAIVTNTTPVTGDPSVFGSNTWNVYGYRGKDITLGSAAEYAGYYVAPTLGFDTTTYWSEATSPSTNNTAGWNGCSIPNDAFTFVHKRQGFPCGSYTIQLLGWDDDVIVYITTTSGTFTYSHNGYSGGAGGAQNFGTFALDANSTIEVRVKEDGGNANAKLSITATNVTGPPTTVSGNLTVGCGTESTTLTASGGTAGTGFTYEWGTGTVVGENIIAGQNAATITVAPAVTTTYWVRRVGPAPCYTATTGITKTVTRANPVPGDPTTFGNGVWNLYGYSGTNITTLSSNIYLGYYTFNTLSFDTQTYWALAASPSSYSGWGGCPVPADNFTFVHKRKGFDCGVYKITLNRWDDAASLYIDGTLVWSSNAWSGDPEVNTVVGNYQLGPNSTIELRTEETTGVAAAKITFTTVNSTDATGITGPSVVCKDASVTLTATGAALLANSVYEWSYGATAGANVIAGQTGATVTVSPGVTTKYWVRIKNTICSTYTAGFSKTVTVPAATVYNNGAWSNGTPTLTTPAEIQTNLEISAPLEACSCLVKNNATVTVDTGATFTIKRKLTVETGSALITQNNGAVVQIDDNVTNEGKVNIIKNSNPLYRLDYTMWSSPVSGQVLNLFSIFTNPTRFYTYGGVDANGNYADIYTVANANDNFATATGYLIRMPNTITGGPTGTYYQGTSTLSYQGTFKGVPNNGTIYKTLNTLGNRYTAVGNPYASPISVKEFYNQNTGVLDGTSAMYFWRKKNDSSVSTYATLTLAAFVANGAAPDGTTTNTPNYQFGGQDQSVYFTGSNSNNNNWLIAPGQGFIVRAQANLTNPQLVFNNTMRKPANVTNASFLKTAEDSQPSRFWLNLSTQTGFSQVAVAYIDGATTGLDFGYDGARLAGGGDASLYSIAADENLAIQARPAFNPSDEVALGYTANVAGQYTFAIDHKDGVFAEGQDVYLKDSFTGLTHNVSVAEYNFTTDAGTFANRFSVIYMQTLGTDNTVLASNNVIVYKQDNAINITTGNVEMTDVTVYDMRGRKLFSQTGINAAQFSVTNLTAQQEVLIVEINTEKGKVSKKIVY